MGNVDDKSYTRALDWLVSQDRGKLLVWIQRLLHFAILTPFEGYMDPLAPEEMLREIVDDAAKLRGSGIRNDFIFAFTSCIRDLPNQTKGDAGKIYLSRVLSVADQFHDVEVFRALVEVTGTRSWEGYLLGRKDLFTATLRVIRRIYRSLDELETPCLMSEDRDGLLFLFRSLIYSDSRYYIGAFAGLLECGDADLISVFWDDIHDRAENDRRNIEYHSVIRQAPRREDIAPLLASHVLNHAISHDDPFDKEHLKEVKNTILPSWLLWVNRDPSFPIECDVPVAGICVEGASGRRRLVAAIDFNQAKPRIRSIRFPISNIPHQLEYKTIASEI